MRKLNMLSAAAMLCLTANLAFLPGIALAKSSKSAKECPAKVFDIEGGGTALLTGMPTTVARFIAPSNCGMALNAQVTVTGVAAAITCQFTANGAAVGNPTVNTVVATGTTFSVNAFQPRTASQKDPVSDIFELKCMSPVAAATVAVSGNASASQQPDNLD